MAFQNEPLWIYSMDLIINNILFTLFINKKLLNIISLSISL